MSHNTMFVFNHPSWNSCVWPAETIRQLYIYVSKGWMILEHIGKFGNSFRGEYVVPKVKFLQLTVLKTRGQ